MTTRKVFIETYGCQMNTADTELMFGLLRKDGYTVARSAEEADVVLINTCAVRERAEERIHGRLGYYKSMKAARPELVLGVTGCMAERLKENLVKRSPHVDIVIGPDAYRRLPKLIDDSQPALKSDTQIDTRLDRREMYADMEMDRVPGVSGWITVQRGCDKFCTFCVVPFVRGRERSLAPDEVVRQAQEMAAEGFREVTLLGQTVSSYYERGYDFADLLRAVHDGAPALSRIRYTSPYPNDFSDRLLQTLAELPRVGRHLHLPVQSGSDRMLADMKRGYTRAHFLDLIDRVRKILPEHGISTDIIVGYPGETEADFEETLSLVEAVQFDFAFMFKYSEREGTKAARTREDDVPEEVKGARLRRLIDLQESICKVRQELMVGKTLEVLVIGPTRRDPLKVMGRTSCFRTTVFPAGDHKPGDLVQIKVIGCTSHTLFGAPA